MTFVFSGRPRGLVIFLLFGALLLSAPPSSASCSPPEVTVSAPEVDPGGRVVASGVGWSDGCAEPREGGCGRSEPSEPPALTGIEVSLVPKAGAGSSIPLGSVDAEEDYGFELEAVVPKSTPPGRYTIEARSGDHANEQPVPIVVTD